MENKIKYSVDELNQLGNRINYYVNYLNECTEAYDKGTPLISDADWDKMYFDLKYLEEQTGIVLSNSPTQTINYLIVNELRKVKHNHPMLSLDKTKDWNEFIKYFDNKDVVGMIKLDGLTCSLRYLNGELVNAETRGNGEIGEDIFHNAMVIRNIPKSISYKEELIIDGEVICSKIDFDKFADKYANPRNFAAGSIRLLDNKECSKRKLQFVAWNVIVGPCSTVIDNFEFLSKEGFTVVPWVSSWDWDAKDFLIEKAEELSYPIDGLVGRFNDIEYGNSLGTTGHHSKAAYAFKFYDETYPTILRNIEWTMGRTEVLTPVAVFDPIEIEDSVVERASLHNISIMTKLLGSPYVGQKIEVFKANMIIPQISSAEQPPVGAYVDFIEIPTICPICGGTTLKVKDNESEMLKCTNSNCEGKFINRLNHFVGKKGLDIKGLSLMTLEKLINWGWVSCLSDIFNLKSYKQEWITKPGFGIKSVDNILNAIENSRTCNLSNFITALGIPLIGTTVSKDLTKYFNSWESFQSAIQDKYNFFNLPNFGIEMHLSLTNFDYTEANEIVNKYITFISEENKNDEIVDSEINGKTFVITGKLTSFKNRDELKNVIEQKGGKVVGSISNKTDYLINNDINSTSSKNISAKKLNIPIITEENFLKMI